MSNPVAVVQQRGLRPADERRLVRELIGRGVAVPAHFSALHGVAGGAVRRDGVVACVVDADGVGWVDRLRAEPAPTWRARTGLPFDALELEEVLLAWLGAGGEELVHVLPEARAFALGDELTTSIAGASMTIAAGLAVVDAASGARAPELRAALALVQREGATGLVAVEHAAAKLAAFARECGRGSLCVVAAGARSAEVERGFDEVWEVASLAELGARLAERGLLAELARVDALDRRALDNVLGLLARLVRDDWRVARALGLARRLRAAADAVGFAGDVATPRQRAARRALVQPLRLSAALGSVVAAAEEQVRAGVGRVDMTHEERALAELDRVQALRIAYRFDDMLRAARGLAERVEVDPLAFDPRVRVRVWSQLGQALAKRAGFEDECRAAFVRALELAEVLGPGEGALARGFWIGALLAMGALEEAEAQLGAAREALGAGQLARFFWAFNRADLARRRGEVWEDAELDGMARLAPGHFWRPLGAYFAATARQVGRADGDRAARFGRAAEAFGTGVENADSGHHLYVALMRLGAAELGAGEGWADARAALLGFVAQPFAAGIAAWFGPRFAALPPAPGPGLEAVLDHDPYLLGRSNEPEWGT